MVSTPRSITSSEVAGTASAVIVAVDATQTSTPATSRGGMTTDTWIAVGSIATAAMAVSTFLLIVIPFWRRPRFSVEFKCDKPFVRDTETDSVARSTSDTADTAPSHWLRVRVTNVGRGTAKGCVGRLVGVTDDKGKKVEPLDPLYLHWVGTSWSDVPFRRLDLARGDAEFLDVCMTQQANPNLYLAGDQFPLWTRNDQRGITNFLHAGKYVLAIAVYGDEVRPKTKYLSVRWGASTEKDISAQLNNKEQYELG